MSRLGLGKTASIWSTEIDGRLYAMKHGHKMSLWSEYTTINKLYALNPSLHIAPKYLQYFDAVHFHFFFMKQFPDPFTINRLQNMFFRGFSGWMNTMHYFESNALHFIMNCYEDVAKVLQTLIYELQCYDND
eukprot:386530_1